MFWHIDTDIVALIVMCALYIYTLKLRPNTEDALRNSRFLWCIKAGVLITIVDIAASIVMEAPVSSAVSPAVYHIVMMLYYILIELVIVAWFYYCNGIIYNDDDKGRRIADWVMAIPFAVYAALVCSNPWSGLFYTLGPDNAYERGPLFYLMVVLYAAYVLALLVVIIARRAHVPQNYPGAVMLLIPLIVGAAIAVQLLNPGWLMIMPGYMICLVMAFLFFQTKQTRSERALANQLNALVENFSSGLAISSIDAQSNIDVQYLSNGYCEIFEGEAASLIESYKSDIYAEIYPDDRELLRETVKRLLSERADYELTYRTITAKGNLKWINVKTKVVRHDDGTATCYSTYTDLTEQEKLQQQLSDLIHTVPCGICLYRWDGGELHPIIANKRLSEMMGENAVNYLGSVENLNYTHIHPADLDGFKEACYLALTQTHEIDTTFRASNHTTGEYLWIRMRGIMRSQPDGTQYVYVSYYDVTQEHLAEQQLRESEQMLEFAAEYAGLWYWRYDAADNRAVMDSKHQSEFGTPAVMENYPDSWIEKGFIEPNSVPAYREAVNRIKRGERQVVFEAQMYLKDGLLHWARFCFTNMFDAEGKVITAICTAMIIDAEKELWAKYELERKRKYSDDGKLLSHAVFNLTTGETLEYSYRDGAVVPPDDRTAFAFGDGNADLLIDAGERERFLALNNKEKLLARFASGETEQKLDYRRRLASGEVIWVRSSLHLVRDPISGDVLLFEYWYDIEEEKMLELTYHSIATDNYEFVARINGKTRSFVVLPKEGLHYYMPPTSGADADDVTMTIYDGCVTDEERDFAVNSCLVDNMKENLRLGGRYQFTYREKQPDGGIRFKKITQYYLDEQREIIVLTREDVTETIKTQTQQNAQLAGALEAANQASVAKSQFLSRVSHELRTPLNAIIGFLELAKGADEQQTRLYLDNSDAAAKQLLSIINDVLDMSSIESGKLRLSHAPFDFKQLIHSITNIYVAQCEQKGLTFDTRLLTPVDDWLIGDKLRVNQILLNLLNNAVKFTSNGSVKLTISQLEASGGMTMLRFVVSDTGCGMSAEMLSRIFKPFEQESASTAQKFGGNGLGLSIVSNLVNLMSGSVSVESAPGKGSTFTVELPFTKSEADIAIEAIDGVDKLRVLTVDDEAVEREYISIVLERIGVRHSCAANGDEALRELERASDAGDAYNICLIDWRMPEMNGIETTRRIREKYGKDLVVIVVSAYEHHQAHESAKEAGANMFVSKPLFQSSLYDLFMTLTGGRIAVKKAAPDSSDFAGRRVLLAEDNAMNRMVAEGLLKRYGASCECAENGQLALEKFNESPSGYYDAILMDIQMPVMDGFEATRQIRASAHPDAKNVQILALTANAFKEDIAKTLACGMNDHIAKPIEPELLAQTLADAFARSDELRGKPQG